MTRYAPPEARLTVTLEWLRSGQFRVTGVGSDGLTRAKRVERQELFDGLDAAGDHVQGVVQRHAVRTGVPLTWMSAMDYDRAAARGQEPLPF